MDKCKKSDKIVIKKKVLFRVKRKKKQNSFGIGFLGMPV